MVIVYWIIILWCNCITKEICAKTTKPRDAFDVKEQRLEGTEAEAYKDIDSSSKRIAKDKWKKTHNNMMRWGLENHMSGWHHYIMDISAPSRRPRRTDLQLPNHQKLVFRWFWNKYSHFLLIEYKMHYYLILTVNIFQWLFFKRLMKIFLSKIY